jgi:hypothetical protein
MSVAPRSEPRGLEVNDSRMNWRAALSARPILSLPKGLS